MPRVSFVDAYDISLTTDGRGRPELFVADKLHFNAHGYKLLAEAVRPYLTAVKVGAARLVLRQFTDLNPRHSKRSREFDVRHHEEYSIHTCLYY